MSTVLTQDEKMERAVVDAINAHLGVEKMSVAELARKMGRPYDSTRNYLIRERAMPLEFLLAVAVALDVPAHDLIREASEKYIQRYS